MSKKQVKIWSDEIYPVYFMSLDLERMYYGATANYKLVEVDEEKIKEWQDIKEKYDNMQKEMREIK